MYRPKHLRSVLFLFSAAGLTFSAPGNLVASCEGITTNPNCLRFTAPAPTTIITGDVCTLSVEACAGIRSVLFKICYALPDGQSHALLSLNRITRPPFKLVWNVQDVPNQLYDGLRFHAEGYRADSTRLAAFLEGVFLVRQIPRAGMHHVAYGIRKSKTVSANPLKIGSSAARSVVSVYPYWNRRELRFSVQLADPLFQSEVLSSEQGVEVVLSGTPNRPHPSWEDFGVFVSLDGKSQRIHFNPKFNADGTFDMERTHSDFGGHVQVRTSDFEGYSVDFGIPMASVGVARPESITCNIVIRTIGDDNKPLLLSWAPGNGNEVYCPVGWGKLVLQSQPPQENAVVLWPASFAVGFSATLLLGLLVSGARRKNSPDSFERSEEEKIEFAHITSSIDSIITNKNTSLTLAAQRLSMQPSAMDSILSKYAGLRFRDYVMRSRVELAKERLRSSHSSLSFIADTCGFKNVGEMEKYFKKLCRTTPYRFRKEFHVT